MKKNFLQDTNKMDLTNTDKSIINYFNHNINTLGVLTINEIAKSVNCSVSSIVRTCNKLGFNGYSGLKREYKTFYSNKTTINDLAAQKYIDNFKLITEINNNLNSTIKKIANSIQIHSSIVFVVQNSEEEYAKIFSKYFKNKNNDITVLLKGTPSIDKILKDKNPKFIFNLAPENKEELDQAKYPNKTSTFCTIKPLSNSKNKLTSKFQLNTPRVNENYKKELYFISCFYFMNLIKRAIK